MAISHNPGDWNYLTSGTSTTNTTTFTNTSGTSSLDFFGGQQAARQQAARQQDGGQAMTPEEARYGRFWKREYNPMHDDYGKRLNKSMVHEYLTHMGLNGDPEYAAVRKHPHVFDSIFGAGAWKEYMYKPVNKAKTGKPTPVVKKAKVDKMQARPPGHERIRVQENGTLLDALQSSFDNWIGKNQIITFGKAVAALR